MEEQSLELKDYLDAFKRRRRTIAMVASVVFLIGALAALFWPPTYQSSATILIKEQDIPPELVQSTVTSYASQRIQAISQLVMARSNLLEIINKYDLYSDDRERLTTEEILEEMRENIGLNMIDATVVDPRSGRPTAATIAFRLTFSGENPNQVQKVANELTTLYLNENLKERSEKAKETYSFLSEEANRLDKQIATYEVKLAAFKEKYTYSLPELKETNLRMLDQIRSDLDSADRDIRMLAERKIYLNAQLSQIKPFGTDLATDPSTRLQALRTEYYRLIARYSATHPDVQRTKREIEALEAETGSSADGAAQQLRQVEALETERAALLEKYSPQHPDVIRLDREIESLRSSPPPDSLPRLARAAIDNPDNPAYISVKSQIDAADSEIASLREKKRQLDDKLSEYERRLTEGPKVEAEYRALARDLAGATEKYQEIQSKRLQAEVAQQLEENRKGERFELIEPAILPEEPVSPNRPAIVFLSLILALGVGFGFALLMENMDDAVRGSRSIVSVVGVPPLAEIPYLVLETEVRRHKKVSATRSFAVVGVLLLVLMLIHNFWQPLDVLWYRAVRKADVMVNT